MSIASVIDLQSSGALDLERVHCCNERLQQNAKSKAVIRNANRNYPLITSFVVNKSTVANWVAQVVIENA